MTRKQFAPVAPGLRRGCELRKHFCAVPKPAQKIRQKECGNLAPKYSGAKKKPQVTQTAVYQRKTATVSCAVFSAAPIGAAKTEPRRKERKNETQNPKLHHLWKTNPLRI